MTTCSIVIPVHNRVELTRRCLDALRAAPPAVAEVELVVVDDCSTDSTAELLSAYDEVRVVRHEQNTGFGISCNDGATAATGEWLVFLNNDTIPHSGWLDALVGHAAAHEGLGIAGAKLLYPDGTVQHAGIVFSRGSRPRHVYAGFPGDHPAVNRSRRFQVVTGACALIRRELFLDVGAFDPAFVNGYEDVDLCLRLGQLGHEVHYCHESVLTHLESATREHALDQQNFGLFLERWGDSVEEDDLRTYVEDGLLTFSYWEQFPALLAVSPQLAVLDRERRTETERLLAQRSRELAESRGEVTRLRLRLLEAGLEA